MGCKYGQEGQRLFAMSSVHVSRVTESGTDPMGGRAGKLLIPVHHIGPRP
jgi:hypothetical protein